MKPTKPFVFLFKQNRDMRCLILHTLLFDRQGIGCNVVRDEDVTNFNLFVQVSDPPFAHQTNKHPIPPDYHFIQSQKPICHRTCAIFGQKPNSRLPSVLQGSETLPTAQSQRQTSPVWWRTSIKCQSLSSSMLSFSSVESCLGLSTY